MANAATTRVTLGALLGTVTTAASTVTSVFDVVNGAVSMGDNYVQHKLLEQRARIAGDTETMLARVKAEQALLISEREEVVDEYRAQSPKHAARYDANLAKISAAMDKALGINSAG